MFEVVLEMYETLLEYASVLLGLGQRGSALRDGDQVCGIEQLLPGQRISSAL
jgi:hypothetical protein